MKKLKLLIVYGPTQEPIDPVRFISNYSTGTMGRCLVSEAKKRGHAVTVIESPKDAQTARELLVKLKKLLPHCDCLVMASAVCDMRPRTVATIKIKKNRLRSLALVQNPDIVAELSKQKKKTQVFAGFALESKQILKNAKSKLRKKGLDLIVAQRVGIQNAPFGDKKVNFWIIDRAGRNQSTGPIFKRALARILIARCEGIL